jgi:hypothetical protein
VQQVAFGQAAAAGVAAQTLSDFASNEYDVTAEASTADLAIIICVHVPNIASN